MVSKRKVAFYTLGCKVNQYETNSMMEEFINAGYEVVDYESFADVYVVNTCTVTNMSDRKSRQILRRAKEINNESVLCAVGCYAQVAKSELEKIDDIDLILGTNDKRNIVQKVEECLANHAKLSEVSDVMAERKYVEWETVAYTDKARAEVKVEDGCDRYCTYCIIPYARGPVRSRRIEDVCEEVKRIVSTGIKEVVITGIHISSYGKDLPGKPRLIELLEKVNDIDGVERIRLGSLEPLIIDDEFVSRIKVLSKVCNHYHLSLQSGCDATLERMNRRYRTEEFREIVKRLRDNISEVALTTDVIVGFPGETDEEFNQTYNFLNEIKFSKMHVFKYSQRRGTKAEKFPNQVDGKVKEERSNALIEMSNKNEEEFAKQYLGKEVEVLFEREHDGHTTNYLGVESEESHTPNEISKVKVKKVENGKLLV
jgi:threonylcarbamoyladenosine tRNA methylthiotransferase MtaB